MAIKADKTYDGNVGPGSALIESPAKATLGYQVQLECADGETSFTIWLTEATAERARETFCVVLGVKEENLRNATYVENQMAIDIAGRAVSFVTEDQGKYGIKVKYLNKARKASSGASPAKVFAALFGGKAVTREVSAGFKDSGQDDDSIPF